MFSTSSKKGSLAIFVLAIVTLACALPEGIAPTPAASLSSSTSQANTPVVSTPPSSNSTTPAIRATPLPTGPDHRIATHRIYGIAGFYDQQTSRSFIPRGVSYAVLVPILDHYEDRLLSPGVFDPDRIKTDFASISAAGYNTLRITLDGCLTGDGCIGLTDGQGLNPTYLDNMVSLMTLARDVNLFLLIASSSLPELGGYASRSNQDSNSSVAAGRNAGYLTPAGIQAAQTYWADLLSGLILRNAPMEMVLGWEIQSEGYYQSDQPPFSLAEGKIKTANGKTYDLSDPAQKESLAEDGLRYYISQVRSTILTYDPTALVTMGFFAPDEPNPWREEDERLVPASILEISDLDFFDFHADPGAGLSITELAANFGLSGHVDRPVLMGEVGASTWAYPLVSDGVIAVQDWIAASCAYGFSGWIYNGFYPSPAGLMDATWGFVDEQGSLLKALSPQQQPDACVTTVLPGRNLALNKPVTVSASLPDETPAMAVDGDPNTQWSAGAFPEQWIDIDLGALYAVGEIRLTVGQWPDGEVLHQVWVGPSQDSLHQLYEISGDEFDYDVVSYKPTVPLTDIRFIRIITLESPSWVSWREIEVLAPFPGSPTPTVSVPTTPSP